MVKTVKVAMFFMHVLEQPGSRRIIFPVAVLYVALLLGISLLEVMTRYRPTVQGGIDVVLEPKRPAPTRTTPHRMPGD
ncbi:MAG TPA: hypothetical protein VLQ93_03560 [Myxococcaceae bacterium]|nr:hypothetical protein [Myxococcaceae bacterium]